MNTQEQEAIQEAEFERWLSTKQMIEAGHDLELENAIARNNQALSEQRTCNQLSIEEVQERQRKVINEARWCLAQGWIEKAREALEWI